MYTSLLAETELIPLAMDLAGRPLGQNHIRRRPQLWKLRRGRGLAAFYGLLGQWASGRLGDKYT